MTTYQSMSQNPWQLILTTLSPVHPTPKPPAQTSPFVAPLPAPFLCAGVSRPCLLPPSSSIHIKFSKHLSPPQQPPSKSQSTTPMTQWPPQAPSSSPTQNSSNTSSSICHGWIASTRRTCVERGKELLWVPLVGNKSCSIWHCCMTSGSRSLMPLFKDPSS